MRKSLFLPRIILICLGILPLSDILDIAHIAEPSKCTLSITPFFDESAHVFDENRSKIEMQLILTMVTRKKELSQIKLNAALDDMYENKPIGRYLNVASEPVQEGENVRMEIDFLEGPYRGFKKALYISPVSSSHEEQTIAELLTDLTRDTALDPWKTRSEIPETAFAGIHFKGDTFELAYSYEGNNVTESFNIPAQRKMKDQLLRLLRKIEVSNNIKIDGIGISGLSEEETRALGSYLWLKGDHVWEMVQAEKGNGPDIAINNSKTIAGKFTKKGEKYEYNTIQIFRDDKDNKVKVHDIVTPEDHKAITDEEEWKIFEKLTNVAEKQRTKILFFNSTAQGGGVALMRHSLISLLRAKGVDVDWHNLTVEPRNPDETAIFEMTKKKLHNVFQNVSKLPREEQYLTEDEYRKYRNWCERNAREKFAESIRSASVIVIDDYQPSGMIPVIKELNPRVKIIYRSHIQIRAKEFINIPEDTPQKHNWDLIWGSIKNDVDFFVTHPIDEFIPDTVPLAKVGKMPATTDMLDGLNKELTKYQMDYYFRLFNQTLEATGQVQLDRSRPYIIQQARFDPSKGISDVLKSYAILCSRLLAEGFDKSKVPQLVIMGHGAVDDPEGNPLYQQTRAEIEADFPHIAHDIKVTSLPHNDQIMNTLLRGNYLALQLSTAEGYEIKVSEALDKRKPVISYNVGGIPLQIRNEINGYVLPETGDVNTVADRIYGLLTDKELYSWMSENAGNLRRKDACTVANAINWLFLATELDKGNAVPGNKDWVRDIAFREYGPKVTLDEVNRAYKLIENNMVLCKQGRNLLGKHLTSLGTIHSQVKDPIDIILDLSLLPSPESDPDQFNQNLETIAGVVSPYAGMNKVNFIFEKGFALKGSVNISNDLKYDIEHSPDPDTFIGLLKKHIKARPYYIFRQNELDEMMQQRFRTERTGTTDKPMKVLEVPVISKELALWMRKKKISLSENQFPVTLEGLTQENIRGLPIRNFEGAFTVGLLKAVLAKERNKITETGSSPENSEEYQQLRNDVLQKMKKIFDAIRGDLRLDKETLEYLISLDPTQRLNRAIETYIPPISRMNPRLLQKLHEAMHKPLVSA
ncbi:MAG: glycosyltransferase [Candidatus Omnitrophota bacterium]